MDEPKATEIAPPTPGDRLKTSKGRLTLGELVHSASLSWRYAATGKKKDPPCEVLFLPNGNSGGPLLTTPEEDYANVPWSEADWPHGRALVFATGHLVPLIDRIRRDETEAGAEDDLRRKVRRQRFDLLVAFGELFEVIHDVAEGLIGHADLAMFATRDVDGVVTPVLTRPELISPRAEPPSSGSYIGSGLDAPELTGVIHRPVDVRSDVYLLGMLGWALLTGIVPSQGLERFCESLHNIRGFDDGIPIGVGRVIRQAIKRAPDERFATVRELIDALKEGWAEGERRRTRGTDRRVWVTYAAHSEIGRAKMERYPVNQDAHLEIFDPRVGWGVFSAMDGVSRSKIGRGELASWLTSTAVEEGWNRKRQTPIYGRHFEDDNPYPTGLLESLASQAHDKVLRWLELLLLDPAIEGGGSTCCSTLSIVGVFRDRCAFCTSGDSPIYLVRLDKEAPFIEKLSVDQTRSLVEIRRGRPPADALSDAGAQHLSSAVGRVRWRGDPPKPKRLPLHVETFAFRLRPGDLVLACSDGISGAFGRRAQEEILRVLQETLGPSWPDVIRSEPELAAAARALVREADERGGRDNLTAVIVSIGPYSEDMRDGTPN